MRSSAPTSVLYPPRPLDSVQARLRVTHQIYSNPERKAHEQLQQRAREQLKQATYDLKNNTNETSTEMAQLRTQTQKTTSATERLELVDLRTGYHVPMPSVFKPTNSKEYPSNSQSTGSALQPGRTVLGQRSVNLISLTKPLNSDSKPPFSSMLTVHRSRSSLPITTTDGRSAFYTDLERQAKAEAERAMRDKKIFTVMGPYPSLRAALRRRGWVEKTNNPSASAESLRNMTGKSRDDITALASHFVRNCTPTLLFAVKATDVGSKVTKSTQLVNHFGKASTFTTKAGLCHNLRSVPWFKEVDPNTFYPRCYNLGDNDEKDSFFEDYRLTACISFLKYFVMKYDTSGSPIISSPPSRRRLSTGGDGSPSSHRRTSDASTNMAAQALSRNLTSLMISRNSTTAAIAAVGGPIASDSDASRQSSRRGSLDSNNSITIEESNISNSIGDNGSSPRSKPAKNRKLSVKTLELAITRCQRYLVDVDHGDLDIPEQADILTSAQWEQYLIAYHQFINNDIEMEKKAIERVPECKRMLGKLKHVWPQYELDGYQNVWIFKPGAKSRGRGIMCTNNLNEILEAIASSDCSLVAQKYIERPFLIYKTKFDIRQWFLVTDWNPLTVWFYGACYLRFCSQEYTLSSFHVSIHLSNNSVQKYFKSAPARSDKLPDDNMWKHEEFEDFLRSQGQDGIWSKRIVPGMKQAILCVLLCTQDQVEHRKTAFELYGADFMLSEDLQPWLIEINSSPSMARTTRATAELVDCVLEDTVKVVLDRKNDRNCDTGLFELIYRQQTIAEPPQSDLDLSIEGKRIKRLVSSSGSP